MTKRTKVFLWVLIGSLLVAVVFPVGKSDETRASQPDIPRERSAAYQIGLAHFAIRQRAKDPDAAQFRNERFLERGDTSIVCGEANLKNAFGGYIGYQPFVMVNGTVLMQSDTKDVGEAVAAQLFARCR